MFSALKRRLNFRELLRHNRRSENEDAALLDHRALAHELNNYDQDRFPPARYDVNMEQKMQVDAFKAALRATPKEIDLANFIYQLAPEHPEAEEGTLVHTDAEESDLTTLGELDYTSSNIKMIKPVDLFSLEDIFFGESEIIPALLIRYMDIVGSDRLAYKRDAAIYYDFCVDQIERHVLSRGVTILPRVPDYNFFRKHAVRVFLQVPDIPNIVDGPFYRYMGDCYIVKSNQLLPRNEWVALPEYLKERFVKRFVETHNSPPKDSYRAQNHYTLATARELLDHGNTYPLIVLIQACQQEEPFEPYSPVRFNGTELLFLPPSGPKSFDSTSVYSQESAPRDNDFTFSSATNLDNPLSPLFTDPFSGNVIITFPSGEQEIYPVSRATLAYDAEDYGVDEDRSSVRSNGEDGVAGMDLDESDSGNEDHGNGDENGYKVQDNGHGGDEGITNGIKEHSYWFDGTESEDGTADIQNSDIEVSESDRARYARLKVFCEELEETSSADTAMGRVQRHFIQNMRAEMAALGMWDDTNTKNGDNRSDKNCAF
ncbi:hypothetical protein C0995_013656 [Termitomyces sp. Mi166|nr:hypothetical protein C0995_013656 [Termitomyces sp. Mi166\